MLETPAERVKVLKAGYTGSQIEATYVEMNDFKIVGGNVLFEWGAA